MLRSTGLGHLARMLAYGYKLEVCCLEKEQALTEQAKYVKLAPLTFIFSISFFFIEIHNAFLFKLPFSVCWMIKWLIWQ